MIRLEAPPGRRGLAALLRLALTSGLFWAVLVMALALWGVYWHYRIRIVSVPAGQPGTELVIHGQGFGAEQGQGYVLYRRARVPLDVFEQVERWSDREIAIRLPEDRAEGGYIQVVQTTPLWEWPSNPFPFVVKAVGLPGEPYAYEVPVAPGAPWPSFRRDHRNTGRSPVPAVYQGGRPWVFRTGKGIFSTPVIDEAGVAYVGSADHYFYAVNPNGTLRWRFKTGELIDSAGILHRPDPKTGIPAVTFGSGDGILYHLRTDDGFDDPRGRVLWTFDAAEHPGEGYNNWFEGNVQLGFDGTLYAGNTNWNYYAINPDGTLRWTFPTRNNNWSGAAIADDGTLFWGSCDTQVYAVGSGGKERWSKRTLGFVAASAAIGSDGTVYIGSFDSHLYAFTPHSPWPKWKFKTQDHVYSSPALGQDADGRTNAIYFGSTDGHFYALDPDGALLWKYYTGEPIRSSPALGAGPGGEPDAIIYFGCGDGRLYALNTADGTRRWSFDTTQLAPELRDRNDLNSSPALGETGVHIGGEHGALCYVPYDYCLHAGEEDPLWFLNERYCDTDPAEDWPDNMTALLYVTPGGNTLLGGPSQQPPATIITLRLAVRRQGETVPARIATETLEVAADPPFPLHYEVSAGGDYLHIIPETFLEPAGRYTLRVKGAYRTGGPYLGKLRLGGEIAGRFEDTLTFHTAPRTAPHIPLKTRARSVDALEFTRLAVPIPTMMPSLNQIGFDYVRMIFGTVAVDPPDEDGRGRFVVWCIGGRMTEDGHLVPNVARSGKSETEFSFPYSGEYLGEHFILRTGGVTMSVTGFDVPMQHLEMRGSLRPDRLVRPGATVYGHTPALRIPTYGPLLIMAGLVNNIWQKLLVTGTYETRSYAGRGTANLAPEGIRIAALDFQRPTRDRAGYVIASFELEPGAAYPISEHRAAILLLQADRAEAIALDYNPNINTAHDGRGNLSTVSLTLPRGLELPETLRAAVMLDVFPAHVQTLGANNGRR